MRGQFSGFGWLCQVSRRFNGRPSEACVYPYMHACMHPCIHAFMRPSIHPSIHPCMYMHTYLPAYRRRGTRASAYLCILSLCLSNPAHTMQRYVHDRSRLKFFLSFDSITPKTKSPRAVRSQPRWLSFICSPWYPRATSHTSPTLRCSGCRVDCVHRPGKESSSNPDWLQ